MMQGNGNEPIQLDKIYARCAQRGIGSKIVDDCLYGRWKHLLFIDETKNTAQLAMA
jgi:hypothetical protein